MNINDFRLIRGGKVIQTLNTGQLEWLKPVDIRKPGNQRALLLLHGFSSTPAVYRKIIPALANIYDAIVCPALPGHASNINEFADTKANQWLKAAEDSCAKLMATYKQVDVIGLSLGGLLACHLSQKFALHHLYLLAPALALNLNVNFALTLAKTLQALGFKTLRNHAGNLYILEEFEIAYRQLPVSTVIEILTLIKEFKLKPVTCPIDVFLGQHDKVVASEIVAAKFANINNAKVHWLQNSAHLLPLDGDFASIINCISNNWQQEKKS
jgi:carboxylesterase